MARKYAKVKALWLDPTVGMHVPGNGLSGGLCGLVELIDGRIMALILANLLHSMQSLPLKQHHGRRALPRIELRLPNHQESPGEVRERGSVGMLNQQAVYGPRRWTFSPDGSIEGAWSSLYDRSRSLPYIMPLDGFLLVQAEMEKEGMFWSSSRPQYAMHFDWIPPQIRSMVRSEVLVASNVAFSSGLIV